MSRTPHHSRRFTSDPRTESQLLWLQRTSAIVIGDARDAPSYSQLLRRAVGLYVDHFSGIIHAARLDDRSTPYPQDLAAEARALEDYGRIIDAAMPGMLTDAQGRLVDWQEAISRSFGPGLTIPTDRKV